MTCRLLLWALTVVVLRDLTTPLSAGAFQFELEQSLEIAHRTSLQAISTSPLLPLQARSRVDVHVSFRHDPMERARDLHQVITLAPRPFVPARRPPHSDAAPPADDPPHPA